MEREDICLSRLEYQHDFSGNFMFCPNVYCMTTLFRFSDNVCRLPVLLHVVWWLQFAYYVTTYTGVSVKNLAWYGNGLCPKSVPRLKHRYGVFPEDTDSMFSYTGILYQYCTRYRNRGNLLSVYWYRCTKKVGSVIRERRSRQSAHTNKGKRSNLTMEDMCCTCYQQFKKKEVAECIGCDFCPRWYHSSCVNEVPAKDWRCSYCGGADWSAIYLLISKDK